MKILLCLSPMLIGCFIGGYFYFPFNITWAFIGSLFSFLLMKAFK